jgi:hypothetical protein
MNRGVSSRARRGGGSEIQLPPGIHSLDAHGNIFASLPEISRVAPKYFTLDEIKTAFAAGKIETLTEENLKELESLVARK